MQPLKSCNKSEPHYLRVTCHIASAFQKIWIEQWVAYRDVEIHLGSAYSYKVIYNFFEPLHVQRPPLSFHDSVRAKHTVGIADIRSLDRKVWHVWCIEASLL